MTRRDSTPRKSADRRNSRASAAEPERKETAGRPPGDELLQLMSRYDVKVGELALALRSMVLEEAPDAHETLFKSYALAMNYSFTKRWSDGFCHVVLYTRHTNLGFNRGAELQDPKGVLVGSGKLIRHIKVERPEDLEKAYLRRFIRAAVRHSKTIAASKLRPR